MFCNVFQFTRITWFINCAKAVIIVFLASLQFLQVQLKTWLQKTCTGDGWMNDFNHLSNCGADVIRCCGPPQYASGDTLGFVLSDTVLNVFMKVSTWFVLL